MPENSNELPAVLNLNGNKLSFTNAFNSTLSQIKQAVDHAKHLASVQSVDKLDEESLETTISDLKNAQALSRNVSKTRRDLKRYLRGRENVVLDQYDKAVEGAGYDELEEYNAKAKQLKKDLSAYRINQRWAQLKPTFDANLENYPIISELAPKLKDFQLFRLRHPKIVNGAKRYHLGDKQLKAINQDLYNISECLQDLKENKVGLWPQFQNSVLQNFIGNPTKDNYLTVKNQAVNQMQQMIAMQKQQKIMEQERKKQEQQQKILAQNINQLQTTINSLNQQISVASPAQKPALQQQLQFATNTLAQKQNQILQAQKQAQMQAQAQQQAQKKTMTLQDMEYKWLGDYVSINMHRYGNLKNDSVQKYNLLYDLLHSVDNPSSQLYSFLKKHAKNKEQQSKIMIDMISFVVQI